MSPDPLAAKIDRGIQAWRPDRCLASCAFARPHGFLPLLQRETVRLTILAGINIVSGLHEQLAATLGLATLAESSMVSGYLMCVISGRTWRSAAETLIGKRVLTVGIDCSVGKMYTSPALEATMSERRIKADSYATGQPGILVVGEGIAINAVVVYFIAGAAAVTITGVKLA